jgi:hypothetical protein
MKAPQQAELSLAVLAVADSPSEETQNAFYRAFVCSRVGARVPGKPEGLSAGTTTMTAGDEFGLPCVIEPDGKRMILALADVPLLFEREPNGSFLEIAARDVLAMAFQNQAGIVVQVLYPRQAWGGIPAHDVPMLLRNAEASDRGATDVKSTG